MAALSSILLGGGALAGGLAGGIGGGSDKRSRQEVQVSDPGAFEESLRAQQSQLFEELQGLGRATGLGAADVQAAVGAQRGVADILQQLQSTSGLPTSQDISRSQDLTAALFAPQREALRQSFQDQSIAANRQAAQLGRETNDPILRAKLAQDQTRQQALLEANQGAAAQNLAFQLPGQRLEFATQRADVLGGLAKQAFSNRSSLLALGNQLSQQERAFRLATATKTDVQEGSFGQALAGAFAGIGQGASAGAGLFKGLSGGLGGLSAPSASPSFTQASFAAPTTPVQNVSLGQIAPPQQGGLVQTAGPQGVPVLGAQTRPFTVGGIPSYLK